MATLEETAAEAAEAAVGGAREIVRSSSIVMLGAVLSRIIGLLREMVIGAQFGTSVEYDAYVAAFRIPDTLFLLLISGAFGSAFTPVFLGLWATDRRAAAWRLANAAITLSFGACAALALVCYLLADWLVGRLIAPGLQGEALALTVSLTRLLLLSPLLLGLGLAAQSLLNARRRFLWPAFAPVVYNLGIIAGSLWLSPSFGIYGLAAGVLIGAAGHFAVQAPALWAIGLRYRPVLRGPVEGLPQMLRLLGPRILGQAAFQLNIIILTNLASRLPEGRLSALNYAGLLATLPHGIFALSLATVIFPTLAEQFGRREQAALRGTVQTALRLLLYLTLPSMVGLILLRVPLVQVLLQWRAFTSESTALVAEAVAWFSLGLVGLVVTEALSRAFFAMHDTVTPVLAAGLAIVVNLAAGLLLLEPMGHAGLALAISLAALAEAGLLLRVLNRRLGSLLPGIAASLGRALLASGAVALALAPVAERLALATDPSGGRSLAQVLWLTSAIGWGVIAYLGAGLLVGAPELRAALAIVAGRLPAGARRRLAPLLGTGEEAA